MTIIILQKWKNPTLSRPDEFNHASSVSRKRSSLHRRTTTTMGKSTAVTQHCTSKQVQTRLSARFLKYDKSSEVVLLTSSSVEIFRNTTWNDKARTIMYKSKEIINLNSNFILKKKTKNQPTNHPASTHIYLQSESSFCEYYRDYKGVCACTGASQLVASSSCAPKPYLTRLAS
jgi:hypothetical protein